MATTQDLGRDRTNDLFLPAARSARPRRLFRANPHLNVRPPRLLSRGTVLRCGQRRSSTPRTGQRTRRETRGDRPQLAPDPQLRIREERRPPCAGAHQGGATPPDHADLPRELRFSGWTWFSRGALARIEAKQICPGTPCQFRLRLSSHLFPMVRSYPCPAEQGTSREVAHRFGGTASRVTSTRAGVMRRPTSGASPCASAPAVARAAG